jgi:WhiB family redox-sensing transcriptional regulator
MTMTARFHRSARGYGGWQAPSWVTEALCAQADPDAWFPKRGDTPTAAFAERICAACPVRVQCLDYALAGADTWEGHSWGIWGGTTPRERQMIRRSQQAQAA